MNIYMRLHELILKNQEMVVATIVDTIGVTPGRRASKIIILPDESYEGTIGGGVMEQTVVERARHCLKEGKNYFEELDLGKIGMECGGRVKVFYEYMARQKNIYLFGGGHIGQAITPLLTTLGFFVNIFDDRQEIAERSLHPGAKSVTIGEYGAIVKNAEIKTPCYALVATHEHRHDEEILRELMNRAEKFEYIGMIGSRKKVQAIFDRLLIEGIDRARLEKVYSPVGIDIGADSPFEIAVSITAEIIAIEKGKPVPHMKLELPERSAL